MREPTPPSEDPAAAPVRAAVRAALALTRRPPTANERLALVLSVTFYSVSVSALLVSMLAVSWGPPAPPVLTVDPGALPPPTVA